MTKASRPEIYSHCSYCGAPFPKDAGWPRACTGCGNITYRNPLPVSVVLVPVLADLTCGILAVRRAIPPQAGALALPGGYINFGESWQIAGAREVFEETGVLIDPGEIEERRVRSAPDGTLIIFGQAQPRQAGDLPPFLPNPESSERIVLTRPTPMAFGLHTEIVRRFFADPKCG